MRKFREIEIKVKFFELLFNMSSFKPYVKNNYEIFTKEIHMMNYFLENYKNTNYDLIRKWCNKIVKMIFWKQNNFWQNLWCKINLKIRIYYINKYRKKYFKVNELQIRLRNLKIRLEQIKYLT